MKFSLLCLCISIITSKSLAQKESFDVVNYTAIKGWKQQKTEDYVSFSVTDQAKGSFCMVTLYKSSDGDTDSKNNFENAWQKMLIESLGAGSPKTEAPQTENGWELQTGTAPFSKEGLTGNAMLITATSQGKVVNMLVLINEEKYAAQLTDFIGSIDLKQLPASRSSETTTSTANTSITGLWKDNILETSGYINGTPQYTAGYFRKEYTFFSNGTYQFLHKAWSAYSKTIFFAYETGTYAVTDNKLTVTPLKGKTQEWSKAPSGRASEWGKLLKSENRKLEKITYSFSKKYYAGSQSTALELVYDKPTEREPQQGNQTGNQRIVSYSSAATSESAITLPPGFKLSTANETSSSQTTHTINSPLAGKIWESYTPEKNGAAYGNLSGFHTGGFWIYQYKFNTDGTYSFVYDAASALSTKPVNLLQYETGTYSVNGNQLTITPLKGTNEEWSVGAINTGMSAEYIRKVLEKRLKRLKASARKLEKHTYTFSIEFWQGNNANALCLKHTNNTVREGSSGANHQSCFFETSVQKAFSY